MTCPLQQSVTWSHQEMPQNGQTLTMLMLSPHLPPPLTSHAVGHRVPPPQKVAVLPSADASFLPRAFLSKGHRDRAGLWLAPCGTWPVLRSRGCPVHSPKALQGTNREPWSCLSGHRAVPMQRSVWLGEGAEHCSWVLGDGSQLVQTWTRLDDCGKAWQDLK